MLGQFREMINDRGNFSINQIILGEFGMWWGNGTDMGLNNWNFSDSNRINYYTNIFQAIKEAGVENACFHYAIDETGLNGDVAYSAHYGVVDPLGQSYANLTEIIEQNYALLSDS